MQFNWYSLFLVFPLANQAIWIHRLDLKKNLLETLGQWILLLVSISLSLCLQVGDIPEVDFEYVIKIV